MKKALYSWLEQSSTYGQGKCMHKQCVPGLSSGERDKAIITRDQRKSHIWLYIRSAVGSQEVELHTLVHINSISWKGSVQIMMLDVINGSNRSRA